MSRRPIPPAVAEWLRQELADGLTAELSLLPPSGDPIDIAVTIEVSGAGAVEARDRLHEDGDGTADLASSLAEVVSRVCGFVPVSVSSVVVRFP